MIRLIAVAEEEAETEVDDEDERSADECDCEKQRGKNHRMPDEVRAPIEHTYGETVHRTAPERN
ncbi:hypothetical protein GCM10010392_68990 [Streptomyces clavifer]|uniref:hypothetical protein n=1 Tax=Streptomyces clavifer TaxID=68188 RepID=UPI00199F1939|nr:hypothetical protein [Streptomyces clavifer]GHB32204.1 hypothetical protein GCM10010392_68990 [Streptomyces clavifer]